MPTPELRMKVGQLFAVGFHGAETDAEINSLIRDYGIGAIVLFKRNIRDAAQVRCLTLALQKEAKDAGHKQPLLIGIDQENGLVTRVSPPITAQQPGPMTLGATGSPEYAYQVAKATGEALQHLGINMNYAPVGDINSEPMNPVIGVRSPGDNPEMVGRFASACAQGLRETQVVPCIKHYPGHGDTAVDSHFGLPVIHKTRDELEKTELVPFRRAVAEGIEMVMTAHIALPGLGDSQLPATLCPKSLGILRNEIKYDGVIMTDCLEMEGVRATYGSVEGTIMALKAGADNIMICHTYDVQAAAIDRVCQAVESGEISQERIDLSLNRLEKLKSRFTSWDHALKAQGADSLIQINEKNAKLARDVYSHATTLVRSRSGMLPISSTAKTVFLSPGKKMPKGGVVDSGNNEMATRVPWTSATFGDVLRSYNSDVVDIRYEDSVLSVEAWQEVEKAQVVILATRNARESVYQKNLGMEIARRRGSNLIVIATCNPYDFLEDPEIENYLAIYEPTVEAFTSAVDILYGAAPAKGKLPVGIRASTNAFIIQPFEATDINQLTQVWNACLPGYCLPASRMEILLNNSRGHHFVAKTGEGILGFCLAFTTSKNGKTEANIAALGVHPSHEGQGIGTALLATVRAHLRKQYSILTFSIGSVFPRFWPGVPTDLPPHVFKFLTHRGARKISERKVVDLYQNITNYQPVQKYLDRVAEKFTFRALQPEDYKACIQGQKKNFSAASGWVTAFEYLHPKDHPSNVMVAFDGNGKQVAWTLMLSPENALLRKIWAFPPVCGPGTGLIGCVGVDTTHRRSGIGLALVCHAILDMKQRGIQGIFVDYTDIAEWYQKVGFHIWKEYRMWEI